MSLNEYISKALNSSAQEVGQQLALAQKILKASDFGPNLLPALQKIQKTHESKVFFAVLLFYKDLLDNFSAFQISERESLFRHIHELCEKTKGCSLSNQLLNKCLEVISDENNPLHSNTDLAKCFDFPQVFISNLHAIENEIKSGNSESASLLEDLMGQCGSLRIQVMFIESKLEKFILSLEKTLNKEVILGLFKLIQNFALPSKYLLETNEKTGCYAVEGLGMTEKVFLVATKIVDLLVLYEFFQQALDLLQVLWDFDKASSEVLYDITRIVLIKAATQFTSEDQAKPSSLLYQIMHLPIRSSYKHSLESEKSLRSLFDSPNYKPLFLAPSSPFTVFDSIGCAVQIDIPAGEDFSYFISITQPNSVLVWGFTCNNYDIGVKLTRVSDNEILYPETRILSNQKQNPNQVILTQLGLYELKLVNSYSWFHRKQAKGRVVVFSPVPSPVSVKRNLIEVINSSDNPCLIPIGMSLSSTISVLIQGVAHEIPSIHSVYDLLSVYPDGSKFFLGIVGPPPLFVPKLNIEGLCTSIDSDALALIGIEIHGPHTVIAVVVSEQVRVSVAVMQSVVYSGTGEDLVRTIAKMLKVFGRAFVLVAGEVDLKEVEREVEGRIELEIVQQSFFRASNDLLLEAASKLSRYIRDIDHK